MDYKKTKMLRFTKAMSISHINSFIDKALEKLRLHYDTIPTGSGFDQFVDDFHKLFPDNILRDVVYASVMTLAGTQITRDVIKQTAWRLYANIDMLRAGQPIGPWTRQTKLEWAAIKLVNSQIGRNHKNILGFWYDYRVLTGSPAGLRFRLFWSLKYIRFLAKSIGFTKDRFIFRDGAELVGMRLYVLFDPELSTNEKPIHYHFFVPASCKESNQKILKQRVRIIPCPKGFRLNELVCHRCPLGYDKCAAGCHPVTYTNKACPRCMNPQAYFDPIGKGAVCVDCEAKEAIITNETVR